MEKHLLSKSTFLRGLQCAKSLYLYKNFIQLRDAPSAEQKAIFNRGNNVGLLAQQLFPGGVDATPAKRSDSLAALKKTQDLIASGTSIIYEAAFQYDGVLAILDILVKENNAWYAYEVKSSVKISPTYVLDASLQYWVITQSGLVLDDISLITMNNQYTRQGALDLKKLYSITSVKKEAIQNHSLIEEKIALGKQTIANPRMPEVEIGEQCFTPYTCDYKGNCWKNVPPNSVFELAGVPKQELFKLYNQGVKTISDIPEKNELDKNANIHLRALKKNEVHVNVPAITAFFGKLTYPLFFMDFETFMPAVPIYEGTKPYQHIPFQYSIHCKVTPDTAPEHLAFLAEQGSDPRKAFVEALLNDIGTAGSILVYDALMERNVLNGLKKEFPEHASAIDSILSRVVDLMQPFQERNYYHPAMKNSHSIKNLLPALVPELSYTNLSIGSGSIAMTAFEHLQTETDIFKIIETREHLLEYCQMDTWAMVKVFEVLERLK